MYCFEANNCNKLKCPVRLNKEPHCWLFFTQNKLLHPDCKRATADCSTCNYRMGWEIGLIDDELFPSEEDKEIAPVKVGQKGNKRFCYEIVNCQNKSCPVREQQIIRCFKYFQPKSKEEKAKLCCCDRECEGCLYKSGWELGLLNEENFEDILEKKKLKLAKANQKSKNLIVEIYMSELTKKPMTQAQEMELAKKIAGDKQASELFLMANLKLVTRIAKKFRTKFPLMDLIQEGNIGLIKAIAKFDYTLGYKFSTYAAYWIKYYMQKAVAEQNTSISIPCHLIVVANKIKLQIQKFEEQLSRLPTLTELSQLLGLPEEKIVNILNVTKTPISIHTKVSNDADEDETIEYYLEDKNTLTPEEAFLEKQKEEAIKYAIASLDSRLQLIVTKFYGINEEESSLAEIGRQMGISRERTRQLLQQALLKLQSQESIIALK